ncbi:hypothetical protein LT337_31945 (plasmid) [Mycolicibacterium fortuitum]|uniref:hypothetical protein n=1 Tax=Mycolicibacterium conceptionense TaxID=451644 RepID=UPI003204F816|nr:hypothetical protein LT337_31945 [Mycolicibacterium fortuitum]
MITTVLAAADPGTMINNALTLVRNVGVPLIILAGSAHLIGKVFGKQFTINALARTAVICCIAVAVFLLLPVFAESFTGVTERVTGGSSGVR